MAIKLADLKINIETNADKSTKELAGLDKGLKNTSKSGGIAAKSFNLLTKIKLGEFFLKAAKSVIKFGRDFLKAGSILEETQGKFDVVFEGITAEAEEAAKNLQRTAGVSETTSKQLLANTADLLTGLGATKDTALELSIATQQLAGDLASFNNLQGGAAEASEKITKALLGEREGLKSLGIVISEERLKDLAEQSGIAAEDLDLQTKAVLTLREAYAQSGNAIGDFERTIASSANQTRLFEENLKDLQADLGGILLPLDALAKFSLNKLLTEVKTITDNIKEFTKSAEGAEKIGAIVGRVAGFFALLRTILEPLVETVFSVLKDLFTSIAGALGIFAGEAGEAGIGTKILSGVLEGIGSVITIVGKLVTGLIDIWGAYTNTLIETAKIIAEFGKVLIGKATFSDVKDQILSAGNAVINLAKTSANAVVDLVTTAGSEVIGLFGRSDELAKDSAESFANTSKKTADAVAGAFRATQEELQAVTADLTGLDEQLENSGKVGAKSIGEIGEAWKILAANGDLEASLALLDQANKEALEIVAQHGLDTTNLEEQFAKDRQQLLEDSLLSQKEINTLSRDDALELLNENLQSILDLEGDNFEGREALLESFAEKEAEINQKRLQDIADTTKEMGDIAKQGLDVIGNLAEIRGNIADKEIAKLEEQLNAEDLTTEQREALQETITAKKKEEALKSFKITQALGIADAIINTAQAVTLALASAPPPAGSILAGLAGALGATQIGVISSQPPPSFFTGTAPEGFRVPEGFDNDSFPINVSSGEVVSVDREGGGQPINIRVDIEGQPIIDTMVRAFNDQEVFISTDNILEAD